MKKFTWNSNVFGIYLLICNLVTRTSEGLLVYKSYIYVCKLRKIGRHGNLLIVYLTDMFIFHYSLFYLTIYKYNQMCISFIIWII